VATTAAVTAYNVGLFFHIAAVVVGLGATFAESITFPVAMMLDRRHLPYVHRLQRAVNQWLTTPALLVVIGSGFYLVSKGDWDFGDGWLSGTFAIVLILGGILGMYFIPEDRELQRMAERDVAAAGEGEVVLSEEYERRARRERIVGGLAGLLVLAAIFLMVTKPGA